MFRHVHPTVKNGDSGPVSSKAVRYGLNKDVTAYADDRYVRCRQCGFMCHLDRDMTSQDGSRIGDSITTSDTTYQLNEELWAEEPWGHFYWGGQAGYYGEPTTNGGCPQCGSYRYE